MDETRQGLALLHPVEQEAIALLQRLTQRWSDLLQQDEVTPDCHTAMDLLIKSGAIQAGDHLTLSRFDTGEVIEFRFERTGYEGTDKEAFLFDNLPIPREWEQLPPRTIWRAWDIERLRLTSQGAQLRQSILDGDASRAMIWMNSSRPKARLENVRFSKTCQSSSNNIAQAAAVATVGDITVSPVIQNNITVAPDPSHTQLMARMVEHFDRTVTGNSAAESVGSLASRSSEATFNINQRMLMLLLDKPESKGWTAKEFASELKCSKSAVAETETWEGLMIRRSKEKAERARDRTRNGKGFPKG